MGWPVEYREATKKKRTSIVLDTAGHFIVGLVDIFRKVDTMSAMAETRSRRAHRRFTDEFKQQGVRLVLNEGKGVTAVARELDLVPSALGQRVKQAQADRSKGHSK